jgi:hypothetical protein
LYIKDAQGELLKKIEYPFFLSRFVLCQLPDKKDLSLVEVDDGFLWITDFIGKPYYKFQAPLSQFTSATRRDPLGFLEETSVYGIQGQWGKFLKDQPECFALVTRFAALDVSVFYIYNQAGQLLYQEVLPDECKAIALVPQTDANSTPTMFLMGRKTVWRYKTKS